MVELWRVNHRAAIPALERREAELMLDRARGRVRRIGSRGDSTATGIGTPATGLIRPGSMAISLRISRLSIGESTARSRVRFNYDFGDVRLLDVNLPLFFDF